VFRAMRVILFRLSMCVVRHLFVFVTLPFAILVSYIDELKISALKRAFVKCLFAVVSKDLVVAGHENLEPDHGYVIVSN
jgi:hypothetical protein